LRPRSRPRKANAHERESDQSLDRKETGAGRSARVQNPRHNSMRSVADDKHKQFLRIWRDGYLGKKSHNAAVREIAELCRDDIENGLAEARDLLVFGALEDGKRLIHRLICVGVDRALTTAQDKRPAYLPKYVQDCMEQVVREAIAVQETKLMAIQPEQVLKIVLRLSRLDAASVLDRLPFNQRNALIEHIHSQMGGKRVKVQLGLENEPEDPLLWTVWYVGHLHALEPEAEQAFTKEGRRPQTCLLIDLSGELGAQPRNKFGEPINLAGPALVKVFEVLTRLPDNQIPAEARSHSALGRGFGVSHKVITRWREHPEWKELQVEITLDGKGGVYHTVNRENQLRSIRIACGDKRGPKPKQPPEDTS
jgi:hypothetical protein